MRGPAGYLAAYGLVIAGLGVLLGAWRPQQPVALIELGAVAAVCLAMAGAVRLRPAPGERSRPHSEGPRAMPDLSFATVLVALAVALLVASPVAGLWLTLVGAGVGAMGVGGLVRERLSERATRGPGR